MQIRASRTKSETPKKYSHPSSRGHRECRVTFLVFDSIKLKMQTCPRRH